MTSRLNTEHALCCAQGEGEVKLLGRLLHPWAEVSPADGHVIYAGDSDMVLMALFSGLDNLYILSEAKGAVGRYNYLAIQQLEAIWCRRYPFLQNCTQV